MAHESRYFSLSLESLRSIGSWAADCTERVLWIYVTIAPSDSRPRAVIEGVWVFARGRKAHAPISLPGPGSACRCL